MLCIKETDLKDLLTFMSSFALQYCFPPDFTSQFSDSAEIYILEIQCLGSVCCLPQESPQDLELCNFIVTDQAHLSLTVISPTSSSEAMNVQENITSACHTQHLFYKVVHDNLQNFLGMCPAVLPFWQVSGRLKYTMRNKVCNRKALVNFLRKAVYFFTDIQCL